MGQKYEKNKGNGLNLFELVLETLPTYFIKQSYSVIVKSTPNLDQS